MEAQNGEESTPEDVNVMVPAELYLRKYLSLQRRCEQVQQTNERLINRLQHVKKTIRKFKKERKFLMEKLDDHGDDYHDASIPYPWEETGLSGPGMPPSSSATADETLVKTEPVDIESFASPSAASSVLGTLTKVEPGAEPAPDTAVAKKPANAFILFCQKQRPLLQEEHSKEHADEMGAQELRCQLATMWSRLAPEKKQVYFDLYEVDKARYELQQIAGRDATSSQPPQPGALLLMDPSLIKSEPM